MNSQKKFVVFGNGEWDNWDEVRNKKFAGIYKKGGHKRCEK